MIQKSFFGVLHALVLFSFSLVGCGEIPRSSGLTTLGATTENALNQALGQIPEITAVGLGCSKNECFWIKGLRFERGLVVEHPTVVSRSSTGTVTIKLPETSTPAFASSAIETVSKEAGGSYTITGHLTKEALESLQKEGVLAIRVRQGNQISTSHLINSKGERFAYTQQAAVVPQIESIGLGCPDKKCVWIKGKNFVAGTTISHLRSNDASEVDSYSGSRLNLVTETEVTFALSQTSIAEFLNGAKTFVVQSPTGHHSATAAISDSFAASETSSLAAGFTGSATDPKSLIQSLVGTPCGGSVSTQKGALHPLSRDVGCFFDASSATKFSWNLVQSIQFSELIGQMCGKSNPQMRGKKHPSSNAIGCFSGNSETGFVWAWVTERTQNAEVFSAVNSAASVQEGAPNTNSNSNSNLNTIQPPSGMCEILNMNGGQLATPATGTKEDCLNQCNTFAADRPYRQCLWTHQSTSQVLYQKIGSCQITKLNGTTLFSAKNVFGACKTACDSFSATNPNRKCVFDNTFVIFDGTPAP